jgi:hypothetical protein
MGKAPKGVSGRKIFEKILEKKFEKLRKAYFV